MSKLIISYPGLQVLSRLICPQGTPVIVYDPQRLLAPDGCKVPAECQSPAFAFEYSYADLSRRLELPASGNTCVFNLSEEELTGMAPGWLIEFNGGYTYPGTDSLSWNIINNPDGSMRWLYPASLRQPRFLAFYNFNYWKATLYKWLVKAAFLLKVPALVRNGYLVIHHRQPLHLETLMPQPTRSARDYAVFTGTAGANRKAVVAEASGGKVGHFLKIALNERSAENIRNEYRSLRLLADLPLGKKMTPAVCETVIPQVSKINAQVIRVTNVQPPGARKHRGFGTPHFRFVRDLFEASSEEMPYRQMQVFQETAERLGRLATDPRVSEVAGALDLFYKLQRLERQFREKNPVVRASIAHGDFTPWNVYSKDKTLFVYDWELCRPRMPALFDLFHYVIQRKAYAHNGSAAEVQLELRALLSTTDPSLFLRQHGLDPILYLQLYLLYNAAYYLEIYLAQDKLHAEAYRLFSIWNELIGMTAPIARPADEKTAVSQRAGFILSFFAALRGSQYAVLKTAGKSVKNLPPGSDLDVLVRKADLKRLLTWIRQYPGIRKCRYTRKSFMTTVQLFFADNGFLSIDLLTAFHRKSLEYLNAGDMLAHAVDNEGIMVLPPAYDYLYIYLFYQLNFDSVPGKYADQFKGLPVETETEILLLLCRKTGIRARSLAETFHWSGAARLKSMKWLLRRPVNRLSLQSARWLAYGWDSLSNALRAKGMVLTFSGVDGAGKTTILGEVRELLEKKYRRKVVVLRHRPSLLPMLSAWKYGKEAAEKKSAESLPRKGTNKNILSSLARFAYYYTDFLLGQLLIYGKYILRGYIVLYDRYYFDFIVDGRRSNILLHPFFVRQLYRFVYKPQLNVFLYAPPEVILRRKKELSARDITELTDRYRSLFHRLGAAKKYLCIENMDRHATMARIEQAYIQLN